MRYSLIILIIAVLLLPLSGIGLYKRNQQQNQVVREKSAIRIHMDTDSGQKLMGVTEYLTGVVASQISPEYEIETLKAQAVIARTCLYECAGGRDYVEASEIGMGWWSEAEKRYVWGIAYEKNNKKIQQAIMETDGQILLYNEKYIYPAWFLSGTGRTRSSKGAWGIDIPWLQETDSEWDREAESYEHLIVKSKRRVIEELHETYRDFECSVDNLESSCQITRKDNNGYVQEMQIGNKLLNGENFRYALELPSSAFILDFREHSVYITVYGEGHGVGFDQYGANRQALEGKKYDELIQYYLRGVKVTEYTCGIVCFCAIVGIGDYRII